MVFTREFNEKVTGNNSFNFVLVKQGLFYYIKNVRTKLWEKCHVGTLMELLPELSVQLPPAHSDNRGAIFCLHGLLRDLVNRSFDS